ncbi:hypothetical protein LCGC14_0461330 [marine sediment metagenome]
MKNLSTKLFILTGFFLIPLGILMAYYLQLAEANAYFGYLTFSFKLEYIVNAMSSLLIIFIVSSKVIVKPSDFFVIFHSLFVLLPYSVLYPMRGFDDTYIYWISFFVLLTPLLLVRCVGVIALHYPLRIPKLLGNWMVLGIALIICLAVVFFGLFNPTESAGFDMATSYIRRLEGRELYPTGSVFAYLNSWVMNGFIPMLAFFAGLKFRILWLFIAFSCWLAFFYLIGVKAPLFILILSALVGFYYGKNNLNKALNLLLFAIYCAFLVFLLETYFFNYSFVADYIIRRAFTVPPFLVSAYFEFISNGAESGWSIWNGFASDRPVSFVVGESFLGHEGLNANTNTFLYQLASGGILAYLFITFVVVSFLGVVDSIYSCRKNPLFIFIGFAFGILVVEQNATTVLVSSGMGIIFILASINGYGNFLNARK